MVAFASNYAPAEPVTRSKNRAGDFFWPVGDRAGVDRLGTETASGKNGRFSYDACRAPSLAQGKQGYQSRGDNAELLSAYGIQVGDVIAPSSSFNFQIGNVLVVHYDGSEGTIYFVDGDPRSFTATSGVPGFSDPSVRNKGPIPPGTYTLNPSEISPTNWKRRWLDPRDWGQYRAPLHPSSGTDLMGRSDFMFHGGTKPGSAGCIDCGRADRWIFPILQNEPNPVPFYVTYPGG